MTDNKSPKIPKKFECVHCNYLCSNKKDYNKHIITIKHQRLTNTDAKIPKKDSLHCICGKAYKHRQSLHNHHKKCLFTNNQCITEDTQIQESAMDNLIKQNEELKNMMYNSNKEHKKEIQILAEQISKISTVTNNTTNTTTNKFNLNFFLNTQCKDAMSIQSFMENIQLGCKELEHMGDVGYLTGMIDIFNNTLGNMDIYKRPLHCTDLKREVLYFKQGTDWEKDSEDKQHLKKLIKNVESKNYHNLQDWQNDHPDSRECDTRENQHYMKIATEALGGADSNKDSIYLTKIMKHILKDVIVKSQ